MKGSEGATTRTSTSIRLACLGALLLTAAGLRTYQLHNEAAWFDELPCLVPLSENSLTDYLREVRVMDPAMVPAYYAVAFGWSQVFGDSAFTLRLLSVALGVISIAIAYSLVRPRFGTVSALACVGCLALSIAHSYYSQEVRAYALVLVLAAASGYTFLRVMDSTSTWMWGLHLAINALLLWTHLFAWTLLVAEGICFFVCRWRTIGAPLLWGFLHAPALPPVLFWLTSMDHNTLDGAASWIPEASTERALGLVALYAGTRFVEWLPPGRVMTAGTYPEWILVTLLSLLALLGIWRGARDRCTKPAAEHPDSQKRDAVVFFLCWLLIPLAVLCTLSLTWRPCLVGRYAIHLCIPFAALVGIGFSRLPNIHARYIALIVLLPLLGHQYFAAPGPYRVDWHAAMATYISEGNWYDDIRTMDGTYRSGITYSAVQLGIPFSVDWQIDMIPEKFAAARAEMVNGQGRGCWLVVPRGVLRAGVEESLQENGLEYSFHPIPGKYGEAGLYHIPAPESG
jgi:hypothetical protein